MLLQILEDVYYHGWSDRIKYANNMYDKISHLLDANFISAFNTDKNRMYERGRELYLGNILNKQYNLLSTQAGFSQGAPDFCIKDNNTGHKIRIECVFSGSGDGSNEVPEFGTTTRVDDGHIPRILRITNSLDSKLKKFQSYRDRGIIKEGDECYIAVNSDFNDVSDGIIIQGACYGRGLTQFKKGLDNKLYGPYYETRDNIPNNNNSSIVVNTLLTKEFSIINGVIYNPNNFMQLISNDLSIYINGPNKFYILENPYIKNTLSLTNEIRLTYDSLSQNIRMI